MYIDWLRMDSFGPSLAWPNQSKSHHPAYFLPVLFLVYMQQKVFWSPQLQYILKITPYIVKFYSKKISVAAAALVDGWCAAAVVIGPLTMGHWPSLAQTWIFCIFFLCTWYFSYNYTSVQLIRVQGLPHAHEWWC